MSSKLEPVIWLRVLVTLAYMKGRTDVRTENDVMAILPNFLPSMGCQYFLSYGAPCARTFGGVELCYYGPESFHGDRIMVKKKSGQESAVSQNNIHVRSVN